MRSWKSRKNKEFYKLEPVIDFADRYDSASIIKLEDNIDNFRYFDNVYDKEGLGRIPDLDKIPENNVSVHTRQGVDVHYAPCAG